MGDITITLSVPSRDRLRERTIRQLGYPDKTAVANRVSVEIDKGLERCDLLVQPAATCRTTLFKHLFNAGIAGQGVCLDSVNWKRLAGRMTDIRELCCFAVTLGQDLDQTIKKLGRDNLLTGFILDAIGSTLADWFAEQAQEQVARYYKKQGLVTSFRFSPGYCDWPMLPGQQSLFPFLRPETIDIALGDSGLMSPRKSVTAAMIVAEQMPAESPCFLCARDCAHRRAPYDKKQDS